MARLLSWVFLRPGWKDGIAILVKKSSDSSTQGTEINTGCLISALTGKTRILLPYLRDVSLDTPFQIISKCSAYININFIRFKQYNAFTLAVVRHPLEFWR